MHFRINQLKASEKEIFSSQGKRLISNIPVGEIVHAGSYYGKEIYQTDLPLGKFLEHTLGLFYVQSLSSMLPALILHPEEGQTILDICAAPGSKSTLLAEQMRNSGLLVANDISSERVKTLAASCDRIGVWNCGITNMDGVVLAEMLPETFDKILLDPPCSALGSLQDTSQTRHERNLKRLNLLTTIQYELLLSCAQMLKPGGEIVYSTCTSTIEENEEMIEKFLQKCPFDLVDIADTTRFPLNQVGEKISPRLRQTLRIDSAMLESEAFFIAKLRKTGAFPLKNKPAMEKDSNAEIQYKKNLETGKNRHFTSGKGRSSSSKNSSGSAKKRVLLTDCNEKAVKTILDALSDSYGIPFSIWEKFLFSCTEDNIHFISQNGFDFSSLTFCRIGMKLASYEPKTGWNLTTSASQALDRFSPDKIIELETIKELSSYYYGQQTKISHSDTNHAIVQYHGWTIGTGKVRNGILFSQFPKNQRMVDILFS